MKDHSAIGKSVPRLESQDKVTGELHYLADRKIRGMLHGKILRSPLAHAKIVSIDASQAEALPGVIAVLTRDDVIGNPNYEAHYGPVLRDQTIVALDKVHYAGDPVAAVAATRPEIAEEALELIEVDYQELPAVMNTEEALAEGAALVHETILRSEGRIAFPDLAKMGPVEGTNICGQFPNGQGGHREGIRRGRPYL